MFRIRTALVGAVVAAAAVLVVAAPASAHDQIVSSTPAADEQLTSAPEQVVLTFSNNLLSLSDNSGTAMTVTDANGEDWVSGAPVVTADAVTVPLKPDMPNGAYDVTWKVVSSDGHPTSGEYSFSIAAPVDQAPSATPSATPSQSVQPPTSQATQTPAPAPTEQSAPWPLLIGLGVVLLIALVVVIVIAARRRR
ncbi:MAG: hypothetical protein BGN97_09510 [Microbacterium sp. 69-10]|uniref:copper resistance CopC family protein n=1 Tax=Microbacterium sp. 69-10 TaxID=1895783 RepID=UPI00095DFE10|nr:copper resistance CopC family protein [Microbacterium sp. 69-10]OJU42555.1 MAG: hypothetical protein BGN97_09510 [Microbacterium sp. 69-10]